MRRSLLLLSAAALSGMSVAARSLSPSEALARVSGHDGSGISRSAAAPQPVMTVGTGEVPSLYIFDNDGNGYLIVSADDVAAPLVGYSDSGHFDPANLPDNFRGWLDMCSHQIREASDAGRPSYSRAAATPDRDPVAPLVKTRWDQGAPYYNYCPLYDGIRTYTGCVATAMAQVMKYHNWPDQAAENVSLTYNWIGGPASGATLSADFSNFRFDWDNMLDSYRGSYTSTQAEAVAKLMQACGYSVEMRYGYSASAAFSESVGNALVSYFKYDGGLHNEPRDLYTSSQWEDMIYENLRTCGPVVYWGTGDAGAHCFVCDGYQSGGYFHFNWGWSGMSDGYFLLNLLTPTDLGVGGGSGGFNSMQGALLGVKPATGTETPRRYTFRTSDGISSTSTNGTYLYMNGVFKNYSPYTVNGKFVMRLYNEDGTQYIRSCTVYSPGAANNFGLYSSTGRIMGSISKDVPDGTYRVYPAIEVGGAEYEFLAPPGTPAYVIYTRSGGRNTATLPQTAQKQIDGLSTNGDIYLGKPFRVTGTARFTGEGDANLYVVASLLKADGTACGRGTALTLTFADGDGEPFEFVSSWFTPEKNVTAIEAGDYTFAIQYFNDNLNSYETVASCPVKVLANAPAGSFEVSAIDVEQSEDADPGEVSFKAHVSGLAGVVYESLYFVVSKNGVNVWQNRMPFFVSAGQNTVVAISASIDGAKSGEKYEVCCFRNAGGSYVDVSQPVEFTIGELSAIPGIGADADTPAEYFDLRGLKVDAGNLAPGIYLRRQGPKVAKILVR